MRSAFRWNVHRTGSICDRVKEAGIVIERESVKSVGAYLESQAEAMRQALAALIEIPSYRTQAEEGAP